MRLQLFLLVGGRFVLAAASGGASSPARRGWRGGNGFLPRRRLPPLTGDSWRFVPVTSVRGGGDDGVRDTEEGTEGDSANGDAADAAWEEEIRRTRAFYGAAPRLSARADRILIEGAAPAATGRSPPPRSPSVSADDVVDEGPVAPIGVAAEDGRAFGNSQTGSYSDGGTEDGGGSSESAMERSDYSEEEQDDRHEEANNGASQQQEEDDQDKDADTTTQGGDATIEQSDTSSQDRPESLIAGAGDEDEAESSAGDGHLVEEDNIDHDEEEDDRYKDANTTTQGGDATIEPTDTSSQDRLESLIAGTGNEDEAECSASDEHLVEEDNIDHDVSDQVHYATEVVKAEDAVEDMEATLAVREEELTVAEEAASVPDESVLPLVDTAEEVTTVVEETRLDEDYIDGTYAQEITPAPSLDLKEEDLTRPHRWERATRATATNKLVEEGLRRLQRRDGDHPSIPYVITRAMQRVLEDELGYDPQEIREMRPDVAVVIVGESLARPPDLEMLPSRFYYNDAEPDTAVSGVMNDTTFKGAVVAQLRRIQSASASFLGNRPEARKIIVTSLGVAISVLLHGSKKKSERLDHPTQSANFPASTDVISIRDSEASVIEEDIRSDEDTDDAAGVPPAQRVFQPDDLDKTWLDKLISLVGKPFGL